MNLFHRQNKSYLSVFPQCALTCALMSAAIKGGPLIRSIHERMFYAKEQILAFSLMVAPHSETGSQLRHALEKFRSENARLIPISVNCALDDMLQHFAGEEINEKNN